MTRAQIKVEDQSELLGNTLAPQATAKLFLAANSANTKSELDLIQHPITARDYKQFLASSNEMSKAPQRAPKKQSESNE